MIKKAMKQLVPALSVGAGTIAQGYASNLIPVENVIAKNGITFVGGLILAGMNNKMLAGVGLGMAGASIQKIAQNFGIGAVEDPIMSIDDLDYDVSGVESPVQGADEEEMPEEEMPS